MRQPRKNEAYLGSVTQKEPTPSSSVVRFGTRPSLQMPKHSIEAINRSRLELSLLPKKFGHPSSCAVAFIKLKSWTLLGYSSVRNRKRNIPADTADYKRCGLTRTKSSFSSFELSTIHFIIHKNQNRNSIRVNSYNDPASPATPLVRSERLSLATLQ